MRRALLVLVLIVCAAAPAAASAAPADLDGSFGSGDGIAEVSGHSGSLPGEAGARMAIGPRDEIFVLYSEFAPCEFECTVSLSVVRFSANGEFDGGFSSGPQLTVRQNAAKHEFDLAVTPDGKPVIAASGGPEGLVVARLGRHGGLDPGFGGDGIAAAPEFLFARSPGVPKIAVQPDGKVVVAVEGGYAGKGSDLLVGRFNADGQLDSSFGAGGEAQVPLATQSKPADVFVDAAGNITIPAPLCCLGGPLPTGEGFEIARLTPAGQPDPAWAGDGSLFYPTPGTQGLIEGSTLAPDGGLFVSYEAEGSTVSSVGNVIKLTPGAERDPSFAKGLGLRLFERVGSISPAGLAADARGRLVGVGWLGRMVVFRLRANGGKDRTFNGGERIVLPYGGGGTIEYMVGLQSNGRIIAFGDSGFGAGKRFGLIALRGGDDRSRCLGKKATIVGTAGRDELTGTPHRDVIAALGGADEVRALGGPDLICGGKGKDKLLGGPGKDLVQAEPRRTR
jgi:uncharacterized delta-60 repeat protein